MAKSLILSEVTDKGPEFCLRMTKKFGSRMENKLEKGKIVKHRH